MQARQDRVGELDLLRLIAALGVTFFHLTQWPADGGAFERIAVFGFLGVPLFFAISGFVILMTAENRSAAQFVNSRVARLYPTFWTCVLLTSVVLLAWGKPPTLAQVAANLTMLPNGLFDQKSLDIVYWSLVVEMKFYGLVWLLLLGGQMRNIETWLAAWLVAAVLATVHGAPHALRSLTLHPWGSLFIAGCYLYLIRTRGLNGRRLAPFCVAMCVSIACASEYQHIYTQSTAEATKLTVAVVLVAIHFVFFALAIRAWSLPPLKLWFWLGTLTYPLYLVHARAGKTVWQALPGDEWVRMWLVLVMALVVASVLAMTVERRACRALNVALDAATGAALARLRALQAGRQVRRLLRLSTSQSMD